MTEISYAPAGIVKPVVDVCPAETELDWLVVAPGTLVGCAPDMEFCKHNAST